MMQCARAVGRWTDWLDSIVIQQIRGGRGTQPGYQFILLLILSAVTRLVVFSLPYVAEDEAIYSALASRILDGYFPYSGAVDNKPIGIFGFYWVIFLIFGRNNLHAIHLFTIIWIALTGYVLGNVCRSVLRTNGSLLVGPTYVLFSSFGIPPDVQGANTELIANLPLVASALFLVDDWTSVTPRTAVRLAVAGLLVAIAVLFRYPSGLVGCAWALSLIHRHFAKQISLRSLFAGLLCLAVGFVTILAAYFLFLKCSGVLSDYWRYALGSHVNYLTSLRIEHVMLSFLSYVPIILFSWWPLIWLLRKPHSVSGVFIIYWLASMLIASCIGWRFFSHYFAAALPPLCVLAMPGMLRLFEYASAQYKKRQRLYTVVLLWIVLSQFFAWNYFNIGLIRKEFQRHLQVSQFVQTVTSPHDQIYVWGDAVQIYLLSDRVSAARFVFSTFQTGVMPGTFPDKKQLPTYVGSPDSWSDLMRDLENTPPAVIIDSGPSSDVEVQKALNVAAFPRLRKFVAERYRLHSVVAGMDIYVRKDR